MPKNIEVFAAEAIKNGQLSVMEAVALGDAVGVAVRSWTDEDTKRCGEVSRDTLFRFNEEYTGKVPLGNLNNVVFRNAFMARETTTVERQASGLL